MYNGSPFLPARYQKVVGTSMETLLFCRLGSVAGPVIQATGRSEFEDGLGSGDFCVGLLISHEFPH
jgi:hypothetical protein